MESRDASGHNVLAKEILQALDPHITTVVTTALEKHAAHVTLQAKKKKDEELISLKTKVDDLGAQLVGARHENEVLRKNLIALIQSHTVQVKKPTVGESSDKQSPVPYATYEKLLQKVETLETQLLDCVEQRKLEASARSYLMNKLKTAKTAAREWKDYHERWVAKHSDCKRSSPYKVSIIRNPETDSSRHVSVDRPAPPSPGVEVFERLFQHDGSLQDSGPQDDSAEAANLKSHTAYPTQGLAPLVQDELSSGNHQPAHSSRMPPAASVGQQEDRTSHGSRNATSVTGDSRSLFSKEALGDCAINEDTPRTPQRIIPPTAIEAKTKSAMQGLLGTEPRTRGSAKPDPTLKTFPPATFQTVHKEGDDLMIVGERLVKRRKNATRASDSRIRVKQEQVSPQVMNHGFSLLRNETLDLDEVNGTVSTPRKRKAKEMFSGRTSSSRWTRRLRQMSEPLETQKSFVDVSPTLQPSALPAATAPVKRVFNPATGVLSPIDPNTRIIPSSAKQQVSGRITRSHGKRLKDGIRFLGEDGNDTNENNQRPRSAVSEQRLEKSNAQLSSLLGLAVTKPNEGQRVQFQIPAKPQNIRLRNKPLSSLQLEDFRLNPRIDHSRLSENTRESRMCLPGCTDHRCCGEAMRTLAASLKPKLPRAPFPESQEDALLSDDEYLLKWYMGNRWDREAVTLMEPDEYSRLLLDAGTKLLAERHGKHRADARRMTPPGFWDMDFPTTQELQKQRREAETTNRALVRDRYEEALRSGRWVFRDELNANG